MRTMHPVLKRGGLFWDRDLLPAAAYATRFARIQTAIATSGDDAWLIFGDVERYGGLAWFSNFLPRTRSALALVPRSGAPTLLLSVGLRDVPAAKTLTWVDDVRPFSRLPRTLVALIEERGFGASRIGLAGVEELLSIKDWSEVQTALPLVNWTSRTADVAALRASKDDCELTAISRAASIVSDGLDCCREVLRPGVNLREVASRVERCIRAAGAEDVRLMLASGAQTSIALRPLEDRVIEAGDTLMFYAVAEAQRYWAEEARTFVVGAASLALRDLAARANGALEAMCERAQPCVRVSEIAGCADEHLAAPDLIASVRAYGYGNGIGLDADEAPVVDRVSDATVPPNAALALRVVAHGRDCGISLARTVLLQGASKRLLGSPALIEIG